MADVSVAAIQAVGTINSPVGAKAAVPGERPSQADFAQWLGEQVRTADSEIRVAENEVQRLALGDTDNLHQVMLNLERARLSLDLVVQVRNRLLDAYQDILRMQV